MFSFIQSRTSAYAMVKLTFQMGHLSSIINEPNLDNALQTLPETHFHGDSKTL